MEHGGNLLAFIAIYCIYVLYRYLQLYEYCYSYEPMILVHLQ